MPEQSVANGLVASAVEFAEASGLSRDALLARANLADRDLSDPDGRAPLESYVLVLQEAQALLDEPGFALRWAASVGMADVSIVGLIMEASRTMGEAFLQLQRYERLAMDPVRSSQAPSRFQLEATAGQLFLVDTEPAVPSAPELVEVSFARLVCGPRRFLPQPHVLKVEFAHAKPDHARIHDQVFQCPVAFSSARNALELHPDVAQWPVGRNPEYVFGVLKERADALIDSLEDGTPVTRRLLTMLMDRLHTGELSAEQAARELGYSRQTLFRRLRDEGASYSATLRLARCRLAKLHLKRHRMSVAEIAFLLGFSDASAFSRAFKRWTGMSPQDYRTV